MAKPISQDYSELQSEKITDNIKQFLDALHQEMQDEKTDHARWEQAVDELDKERFCIKTKKVKPWPGCANYKISVIDNKITTLKPYYINSVFGVQPIVSYIPFGEEDIEKARKREWLFDWRLRTQVKPFKEIALGIDQILGSQGMTVFRVTWKFKANSYVEVIDVEDFPQEALSVLYDARVTDDMLAKIIEEEYGIDIDFEENVQAIYKAIEKFRGGETKMKMSLLEKEDDQPEIVALNVKESLIIPKNAYDIQDAAFIDYFNIWKTVNDIKKSINSGEYESYTDDEINSWIDQEALLTKESNQSSIQLHEVCCYYDINNDGIAEKCIALYPDKAPQCVLKFMQLPYDHGEWPYVQVKREVVGPGFYECRGLPTLLLDYQSGISTALNQAIDNGTITNSPERVARKGVISNARNRRYIPGELTEVNGSLADYETRQGSNMSQPTLLQLAQYLKAWSDITTSQTANNFSSDNELPGTAQGGKKTAAEVNALVSASSSALSLDLQIFQWQMVELWKQIDALYMQFGEDEEYIRITGEKPEKITRQEIQGHYDIVPNGRIDNLTAAMRMQKTVIAMQYAINNPYVKMKELTEDLYAELDPRFAKRWIKSDEELAQEQQMQQQAMMQQAQMAMQAQSAMKQEETQLAIQKDVITNKEKTKDEIRKEAILAPITGKKYSTKD